MKAPSAQTPEQQTILCTNLNSRLFLTPALQEPIYIHGGHLQAIKAMKSFATNADVQVACSNLLGNMVQWNWVLARAVADAGALDVMFTAMKNFPDNLAVRGISGQLAAFCDLDIQNKRSLVEQGVVDYVYNVTDKYYTTEDVAQMYNLWSTLCALPEVQ